jgi:predicted ATP-binding protein involved in virulence
MILQEFSASKLFGYLDIKIPIVDNKLIIVAENGAGKTTLLRLMYIFLSKQWNKLIEYDFERISVVIDQKYYEFLKTDLDETVIPKVVIEEAVLDFPIYEDFIRSQLSQYSVQNLLKDNFLISELETQNDVPISMIYSIVERLSSREFDSQRFDWQINILYLPTYRRIERNFEDLYADLDKRLAQYIRQLFPQIQKQIEDEKLTSEQLYSETEVDISNIFENLWRERDYERWNNDLSKPFSMELIEFGMDDVQFRFSEALSKNIENRDLIEMYLKICNTYLGDYKEIVLTQSGKYFLIKSKQTEETLPLSVLSSGEKQIMSLFSYFLNQPSTVFIIIDEPELSLSITWQERLIDDILSFDVNGIIAATHSPFIVTNTLKSITHGLNEFIE